MGIISASLSFTAWRSSMLWLKERKSPPLWMCPSTPTWLPPALRYPWSFSGRAPESSHGQGWSPPVAMWPGHLRGLSCFRPLWCCCCWTSGPPCAPARHQPLVFHATRFGCYQYWEVILVADEAEKTGILQGLNQSVFQGETKWSLLQL